MLFNRFSTPFYEELICINHFYMELDRINYFHIEMSMGQLLFESFLHGMSLHQLPFDSFKDSMDMDSDQPLSYSLSNEIVLHQLFSFRFSPQNSNPWIKAKNSIKIDTFAPKILLSFVHSIQHFIYSHFSSSKLGFHCGQVFLIHFN